MVSASLPDLMRMQLLSRLLSDLFPSRNKTVACFDQETKSSLASIKKRNRRSLRSRNETRAYLDQETKSALASQAQKLHEIIVKVSDRDSL
jgi:hypothetical protein